MAVTRESLIEYMREAPDLSADLSLYINAAKADAKAAGVPDFKNNALYDLFIHALAAHYYDNRGLGYSGSYQATADATAKSIVNAFVLKLRYAEDGEPVENEEAEAVE